MSDKGIGIFRTLSNIYDGTIFQNVPSYMLRKALNLLMKCIKFFMLKKNK